MKRLVYAWHWVARRGFHTFTAFVFAPGFTVVTNPHAWWSCVQVEVLHCGKMEAFIRLAQF